ncbi:kinase-like protein [Aspergillus californicus]
MSCAPAGLVAFYKKNPEGTIVDYVAELLANSPDIVFTTSLQESDCPVVTADQLRSATILNPRTLSANEIFQITESTVLKVGWRVRMSEAEALILVADKTNVPVPKVLSAYTIGDLGFILMSKIEGDTLGSHEDSLSTEQFESIIHQLKSHVLEWRTLRSPYLGSVDGGPCEDIIFRHIWDANAPPKDYGPFQSLEDYKLGIIEAVRLSRPPNYWTEAEEELKERILSYSIENAASDLGVLTHGDLHSGNIMVKDGSVTGIVDWGEAGYSLPEREFFGARRIAIDRHWIETIPHFIPELPEEYKLWDEVDRSMRIFSPV